MFSRPAAVAAFVLGLGAAVLAQGQQQTTPPPTQSPIPKPFPGSVQPGTPPGKPSDPATQPAAAVPEKPNAPPAQALAGAPVYPGADFLETFDAGRGQKYFIYGTNTPYLDIINYYRQQLGGGGRELFRAPPMQQFDLGRFDEQTMAFPPSVVVKDYAWNGSPGYLFIAGTTEKRYRTIIQIVPAVSR